MSATPSTGVVGTVPNQTGCAAYTSTGLHPLRVSVVREGRYETAPFRPYIYGASNDVTRARVSRNSVPVQGG